MNCQVCGARAVVQITILYEVFDQTALLRDVPELPPSEATGLLCGACARTAWEAGTEVHLRRAAKKPSSSPPRLN